MIYWLLQLLDLIAYQLLHLFFVYGAFVWSIWIVRMVSSSRYKPFTSSELNRPPISILVPIYNEKIDVLRNSLKSMTDNTGPGDEVIALIDIRNEYLVQQQPSLFSHPRIKTVIAPQGKRAALVRGFTTAKNPILMITGSDTQIDEKTVSEIIKPFDDPKIGGVTGRVMVASAKGIGARCYKWSMELRNRMIYPGLSASGTVHVLNGECYAVRGELAVTYQKEFINQLFLEKKCDSGDDGWMTTLLLKYGHKTVYQSTAIAVTQAPSSFEDFLRQQTRWNRNSTRRSLMVLTQPWAYKHGALYPFQLWISLIKLPFWVIVIAFAIWRFIVGHNIGVVSTYWLDPFWHDWRPLILLAGIVIIRGLRGLPYLISDPEALLFWPLYSFIAPFILAPYKLWAMLTARNTGWLTRQTGLANKKTLATSTIILILAGFLSFFSLFGLGIAVADDDCDSY